MGGRAANHGPRRRPCLPPGHVARDEGQRAKPSRPCLVGGFGGGRARRRFAGAEAPGWARAACARTCDGDDGAEAAARPALASVFPACPGVHQRCPAGPIAAARSMQLATAPCRPAPAPAAPAAPNTPLTARVSHAFACRAARLKCAALFSPPPSSLAQRP